MTTEAGQRRTEAPHPTFEALRDVIARYLAPAEIANVERAYRYAAEATPIISALPALPTLNTPLRRRSPVRSCNWTHP